MEDSNVLEVVAPEVSPRGRHSDEAVPLTVPRPKNARPISYPIQVLKGRINRHLARADQECNSERRSRILDKVRELSLELREQTGQQGNSYWWPLCLAITAAIVLALAIAARTRSTYYYHYPENYLRIVENVDPYTFIVQRIEDGHPLEKTEMHFCRDYRPRFEAGHTLAWIRFNDLGSCVSIGPDDRGFGLLREEKKTLVNGQWQYLPVLAPNCQFDWPNNHVACKGGKAEF